MFALTGVLHLNTALFQQGLETEIGAAKADAQLISQDSRAEISALMQAKQTSNWSSSWKPASRCTGYVRLTSTQGRFRQANIEMLNNLQAR